DDVDGVVCQLVCETTSDGMVQLQQTLRERLRRRSPISGSREPGSRGPKIRGTAELQLSCAELLLGSLRGLGVLGGFSLWYSREPEGLRCVGALGMQRPWGAWSSDGA
ncbi:unnamed protein product, partial [Pleuronectes platessa]